MECKSHLRYTTAKDGIIYKISDVVFDTKADKSTPKAKPEPVSGVPPHLADQYVVGEHAHQYETHDSEKNCKVHHTAWPTSGLLVLERCENQCAFCGAVFKWTWFLRRHVSTIHATRDYPNLTVAASWTSPNGSLKRCQKQARKAIKLAARSVRKKTTSEVPVLPQAPEQTMGTVDPALLENTVYEPLPADDWEFGSMGNVDLGGMAVSEEEWERDFADIFISAI